MWLYKCFSFRCLIFFILVLCVNTMNEHKNKKKQLNIDLDIFKNKIEANESLQELIKHYKYLEKNYIKIYNKSDENTESDSSESEIDEVFRQYSSNKRNKDKHFQKKTFTTNNPSTYYRGTAYIYEYKESSDVEDKDAEHEREESVKGEKETTSEEASLENNAKIETSSEKVSGSDEFELKTESDEVVEIKIDSAQESIDSEPELSITKTKPQRYPKKRLQKKRFSVLQSSKDTINIRSNKSEIPLKIGNQRIVYSEQFSPDKIWHEIINRPIKLNRVISSKEISKLSGDNDKNTGMVFTEDAKKEDSTKMLDDLETQENLSKVATDGNSIIRNGYGDVCIQVPIKKCKKALKAVNKKVCKMRFKCKSDFKSDFDENSKTECVMKFSYIYTVSKESNHTDSRRKEDDNKFQDGAEYRYLHENISTKKSMLSQQNKSQNISIPLSLRDKYEKKCQKELRNKCIAAGNDATERTCSKHTCDKKKQKALQKAVKEECKNIFVIDNKSSDESSDNSSNSDESNISLLLSSLLLLLILICCCD